MATFNGTQIADEISGTNDADIITGLAGDDVINGAGGDDTITGGADSDNILGGAGDDAIIVDAAAELGAGEQIDGGDDNDTLVTELADLDDLDGAGDDGVSPTIWGMTIASMVNVEYVQVTNASDFTLELGTDTVFAFDQALDSTDFGSTGDTDLVGTTFTSNVVGEDGVTFDEDEGITIDGVTYADGDTFATVSGGEVEVDFDGTHWELDYSGPAVDGLALITAESTTEEQTLAVTATDMAGNEIDITVTLNNTFGTSVDLDGQTAAADTKVIGGDSGNWLTSGAGDDTLIGNGGSDSFDLYNGDNTVWAGATDDSGDSAYIYGDGDNTVGLGVGGDYFEVNGAGDNMLYGGAGDDDFYFDSAWFTYSGAEGSNTAWGGADDDDFDVYGGGDNVLGGGVGADDFWIYDDSTNTIYLGADDDNDDVYIYGDSDNTIFGGVGEDGTGSNYIDIDGGGDNTVFNGNGDDHVYIDSGATGDNLLWGGVGDDLFEFAGGSATVAFAAGNGVDTIEGFVFDGTSKIDVTQLGFADVDDVLASMSDAGDLDGDTFNDVLLFVDPGQGVVFSDMSLTDFQLADPAAWLVV